MTESPTTPPTRKAPPLAETVGAKAARMSRARRDASRSAWYGVGFMGLIGWSVAVPTLLGAGLGLWLDTRYPGGRSWTLPLLLAGLGLGGASAWRWIAREDAAMRAEDDDA